MPHGSPRLTSLTLATLLALSVAAGTHAQVTTAVGSRVDTHVVDAPSLAGNLIGDATEKRVLVYLPPGYDADTDQRYPVIYLLHGIFDSPEMWIDYYDIPTILNRMIEGGRLPPAIVVMPDGGNHLGGGFYRDSPVSGRWADFIADELREFVDSTYRTDARREARAVTGHSMGGYGAIHLTMERPDIFGIAYAMSPCCLAPIEDIGQSNDVWRRVAEVESWDEIEAAAEARDFWLVGSMGILTAFSPAAESPPMFVALPFGVLDGERVVIEEVFSEYRAQFPLHRLDEHWPALASLQGLAIDYGIGDQFSHIPVGGRRFSERLAQLRIPHLLDVYDGDHREEIAARLERIVFPFIAERLTRPAD
jgi:S-formylglutathione hydrolase FrmB